MGKKILVVVNPTSGGGASLAILPRLRKALQFAFPRSHEVVLTEGRGHAKATVTARLQAHLHAPIDVIVAVGGDGTLHEVVNGLYDASSGMALSPSTKIAILSCGTGGDFAKSVPAARTVEELMQALDGSLHVTSVDIGRVCFLSDSSLSHWFVNVLSFGVSCETIRQCDTLKKSWLRYLGGKVTYMAASAISLLKMRLRRVRIMLDRSGEWNEYDVCLLAIANGKYFGGGMQVSPLADPTDRTLNITVWREGLCGFLTGLWSVYNGRHVQWSSTVQATARVVDVEALDHSASCIMLDSDGELCGHLPVSVSLEQKVMLVSRKSQTLV